MKQLIQHVRTGQMEVAEVPAPKAGPGRVLVRVGASLISAGTERMVSDFARKSILAKAKARPDLVRQVVDKAQREGILPTLEALRNRLDQPMALGYSCAGTVLEVGPDVPGLKPGDRLACAGGGYAAHAEVVSVPKNLTVRVPGNIDLESAAFTTLGAIALQGIRLADLKLGEIAAVIGLGLLGQLMAQMLKAAGCLVAGMDLQPQRAELARQCGIDAATTTPEDLAAICRQLSAGHGPDAVLITADTPSSDPVVIAGELARDKGIVVAVGAVGMEIPRKLYYEKELDFRISRSYGPGRYDFDYEENGLDYPYAYVRWTEQRNMEAFVQLLSQGKLDVRPLITHRFTIDDAPAAYDLISGSTGESFLGVLLTYPGEPDLSRRVAIASKTPSRAADVAGTVPAVKLGVLGAGNFANATLLPALKKIPGLELVGIASGSGLTARSAASRFGFSYCSTDSAEILGDPNINTIAILTRHHLHARQVIAALEAGKHVFVEKPLCLTDEELEAIIATYRSVQGRSQEPVLMTGFNRRFAPFIMELKRLLEHTSEPLMLHYRVNAGYIPQDHWTQDPTQGGGRLRGEACHFIDLLLHLAGSPVQCVTVQALPDAGRYSQDNLLIILQFANGSLGTVTYAANGSNRLGKECLDLSGGDVSARLDDYRTIQIVHGEKRIGFRSRLRQDKGHRAEWEALVACLTGKGPLPMPFEDIVASTRAMLAAHRSLIAGGPVAL